MNIHIHRILGWGAAITILLVSLSGCSQTEVYGTLDSGIGVYSYSSK